MRYARIIKAVTAEPWLITPEAHAAIVRLLNSRLGDGDKDGALLDAQRVGFKDEPLPSMTVANGVAVIPVNGVLGRGLSAIEKSCGATDYRDVDRDLTEAQWREDVSAIVLDIDSPGGAVAGLEGLAHRIAEIHSGPAAKRVIAFTGGEMASAALFLGVAAQAVYAERGAIVGSVGTIYPFVDQSESFAKQGLKVDLITSTESPLKGTAWPGTSLKPEQRDYLQKLVDEMDANFRGFVKAQRPLVHDDAMKGQVYGAAEGKRMGIIDGVVSSINEVITKLL